MKKTDEFFVDDTWSCICKFLFKTLTLYFNSLTFCPCYFLKSQNVRFFMYVISFNYKPSCSITVSYDKNGTVIRSFKYP